MADHAAEIADAVDRALEGHESALCLYAIGRVLGRFMLNGEKYGLEEVDGLLAIMRRVIMDEIAVPTPVSRETDREHQSGP